MALGEPVQQASDDYSDHDVLSMYLNNRSMPVREIAAKTNRSLPEVYRVIKKNGFRANRRSTKHQTVLNLAEDPMMTPQRIADLTNYSKRNVNYILRKNRGE